MYVTSKTRKTGKRVYKYLLAHPDRHNQDTWFEWNYDATDISTLETKDDPHNICGTTMCVAGTAVFLSLPIRDFVNWKKRSNSAQKWEDEGGELLGLEGSEKYWLFYEATEEEALAAVKAIGNGDEAAFNAVMNEEELVPV